MKPPCSVTGCPREHYARGYCNAHWRRFKRNGQPGPLEVNSPVGGLCAFERCSRPHSAKGYCPTHYAQFKRGIQMATINDRLPALTRDAQGRKRCATCKEWFELSAFAAQTRAVDGLMTSCKRCKRERVMAQRYGVNMDQYERLAHLQSDVCAICGGTNASGRSLAVDHDHRCCPGMQACGTCVRGLLCSACNMGLGQFREDPVRLKAAIAYLAMYGGAANGDYLAAPLPPEGTCKATS